MPNPMVLTVDTGALTIDLRDQDGDKIGEFKFNPTDSNILSRYEAVVDFFNSVTFADELTDAQQLEAIRKLSAAICEQLDFLLGYQVSQGIFSLCGPLSVTASGDFFFEVVMEGIAGLIENVAGKRLEKKMAKVRAAIKRHEG